MPIQQLCGRKGAAEQPDLALHTVDVSREGQITVSRVENLLPQLRNMRRRDVVKRFGHAAVGRAEIISGQRAVVPPVGQRTVVGDARQGDRVVAAPQVDRLVAEHAPSHRLLAFDERGDIRFGR